MDMRTFAGAACPLIRVKAGNTLFSEGDPADTMYIIQSGAVELLVGGKTVDVCEPGDTLGFMAVIDAEPRSLTARAREDSEISLIDRKKFKFMVAEVPNFALYVMQQMARRIRGISHAM